MNGIKDIVKNTLHSIQQDVALVKSFFHHSDVIYASAQMSKSCARSFLLLFQRIRSAVQLVFQLLFILLFFFFGELF